jgi:hypothetical protein
MNTIDTNPNFADPRGTEHNAFRMYLGSLTQRDKVNYLQFLETNFASFLSDNYYSTFSEFDPILLSVEPTEVVTRIHFIWSDLNPSSE